MNQLVKTCMLLCLIWLCTACNKTEEIDYYTTTGTMITYRNEWGVKTPTQTIEYNQQQYPIRIKNHNKFTNDSTVWELGYDWPKGVVNKISIFNIKGQLQTLITYQNEYNDQGNLIKSTCTHPNYVKTVEYTYTSFGKIDTRIMVKNDTITKSKYEYVKLLHDDERFLSTRIDSVFPGNTEILYSLTYGSDLAPQIEAKLNKKFLHFLYYYSDMSLVYYFDKNVKVEDIYSVALYMVWRRYKKNVLVEEYKYSNDRLYPINPIDPFQYDIHINKTPPLNYYEYFKPFFDWQGLIITKF